MKGVIKYQFVLILFLSLFMINFVSAASIDKPCDLDASLVNQDPYPAIQDGYVEVLFQINGVNDNCYGGVVAELVLDYPFSLDLGDYTRAIKSSTYAGYGTSSHWNLLYKLRVDKNAIEGDYEVELRYGEGSYLGLNGYKLNKFNITVEDGRTDFEIHIDNYKIKDKTITFEILNTGNQDIEALTLEIPQQPNIDVKGSNRNIVGDLDSNEYTTADFEAIPYDGNINIKVFYTDVTNERRVLEKTVYYDSSYFLDTIENKPASMTTTYTILGIIVLIIAFFIFRRFRKNSKSKNRKKFKI